jgi:CRP-like cAMP-binding protein
MDAAEGAAWLQLLSPAAGESIYREGETAAHLYVVEKGLVALSRCMRHGRRQIVELLGPGDVFGFDATGRQDSSAEALIPSSILVYERDLLDSEPRLRLSLLEKLRSRISELHDLSLTLGQKTASERVATFIYVFAERFGSTAPGSDRASLPMPLSRQQQADLLGLTLETVSREFSRLRQKGIVSSNARGLTIHSMRQLAVLTGDEA